MNNQTTEKELIEVENQYWIQQAEDLASLEQDPRFQRVILDGYFRDRALDAVSLLANDYVRLEGKRPEVMELLIGISTLQDHFGTIRNLGSVAEDDVLEAEGPEVEGE